MSVDGITPLRGHITDWSIFVETLDIVVQKVIKMYPGTKIHLWANSYGAKIITSYLLISEDAKNEISSTVFTTPGLFRKKTELPVTPEMLAHYTNRKN